MKIFLQGHEYKYDVENIVRLFFINEKIEFIDDDMNVEMGKDYIISRLNRDGDGIIVDTLVSFRGCTKEDRVQQRYDGVISSLEFSRRCKSLVKLSLYRTAKQLVPLDIPWGTLTGIRPTKIVHMLMEEGKSDDEIHAVLSEQYDVSYEKIQLAIEVAKKERKILM